MPSPATFGAHLAHESGRGRRRSRRVRVVALSRSRAGGDPNALTRHLRCRPLPPSAGEVQRRPRRERCRGDHWTATATDWAVFTAWPLPAMVRAPLVGLTA